jgi:hypothetical protein
LEDFTPDHKNFHRNNYSAGSLTADKLGNPSTYSSVDASQQDPSLQGDSSDSQVDLACHPFSLSKVLTSDPNTSRQYGYSTPYMTADQSGHAFTYSAAGISQQDSSLERTFSGLHPDQAHYPFSSSMAFRSHPDSSIDNYSLTRFMTEPIALDVKPYTFADEIVEAHTTTMKKYLDDFDAGFYQE